MIKYNCYRCLKSYNAFKSLKRHVKDIHPSDLEELATLLETPKKKYSCCKCTKQYNSVRFLRNHEKKDHNVDYVPKQQLNYCPICKYKGFQKRNMILHFNQKHQINIKDTECHFTTLEEFSNWKSKIESETRCKFLKRGGCNSRGKTNFFYFICHRSGIPPIKTQRKRTLKRQGSIKINGLCPSSMTVKCEPNGNVKVKYVQTHVGHKVNLSHLATSLKDNKGVAKREYIINIFKEKPKNTNNLEATLVDTKDEVKRGYIINIFKDKPKNTNNLEATLVDTKDEAEDGYIIEIFNQESENSFLSDEIDKLGTEWNCIIKNLTNRNQIQAVKNHLKCMKESIEALEN